MKKVYLSVLLLFLILTVVYSKESIDILSDLKKASLIENPCERLRKYDSILNSFKFQPEVPSVNESTKELDNNSKQYIPERLLEFKKSNTSAAYDKLLNSLNGKVVHWTGVVDDVKTSDSTISDLIDYYEKPYIYICGERSSFLPDYVISIYGNTDFINSLRIGDKIKYTGKIVWIYDEMFLSIDIIASNLEKL